MNFLLTFGAMFMLDWVWAKYNLATTDKRAGAAAAWAAVIPAFGYVTVTGYLEDPWTLLSTALGSAAGTYYSVRHSK